MFCAYCGKEINDSACFCPFCGNSVSGSNAENGEKEIYKTDNLTKNFEETVGDNIDKPIVDKIDDKAVKDTIQKMTKKVTNSAKDFTNDIKQVTQDKNAANFFTKNKYKNTKILIAIVFIVIVLIGGLGQFGKPGAEVRDAYLTEYSKWVTVEDAFDNFFEKGKWSTYKDGTYSYVVFSGVCYFMEERVDVRITFKVTGENFIVDNLEINGQVQSDYILYGLLSAVYED